MVLPKYQEIINELILQLDNGQFQQGDKFYSESDICNRFNVSSTTAVRVLNKLAEINRVTRIQGKGTFVSKENHNQVVKLTDLNMDQGNSEDSRVLSIKKASNPEIAQKLFLTAGGEYYEIRRQKYIGDEVVQFTTTNMIQDYVRDDLIDRLELFSSIYHRINEDFDIDPYKLPFSQVTTAAEINDGKILAQFDSRKAMPLIIQKRITFLPSASHRALEYVVSYKKINFWGYRVDSVF